MTTQERLEAIQALTAAASQLSNRNFSKTNLVMAISEIQNALEALKIDTLNVDESCVKIAKRL